MTTTHLTAAAPQTATPTERLLTASLVVAPLLFLAADSTYAARGWDDDAAGVLHVLAATAYGFVILRVAGWTSKESWLRAAIVLTGIIGLAGDVAYGFDTIHMSLGDTKLVDQPGAANLIKPWGLFFPLSLALVAWALVRLGNRWQGVLVLAASVAWPVAHIGNIAVLAVLVNVALVLGLGSMVWSVAGPVRTDSGG
jgi:hypothetical protein